MSEKLDPLRRERIIPEGELPSGAEVVARGRARARSATVGRSAFLEHYGVASEQEYKALRAAERAIMLHGQIGYRDPEKSRRAYAEIFGAVDRAGGRLDRYGICLDWSMGYPAAERADRPRGTGLILEGPEDFARLTEAAPVAPHFGDFAIGLPAAVENAEAALAAGSTSIGNLGQYFTFRMPQWEEDIATTEATVEAMALCAAQPVPVIIHSNLDDGFAALFTDLSCSVGAVMIERHIVEGLIGGVVGHCYGNTFSQPLPRLAFQRVLARGRDRPTGTMVYGNTTRYRGTGADNYAALASYLAVDIAAQRLMPSGHAVNPVPITEAERIPDIDEVIDVHLFALRFIEKADETVSVINVEAADRLADTVIEGGGRFRDRVLEGLDFLGYDTQDPLEMLLAIRRIGPGRLEAAFGPGEEDEAAPRGRRPIVEAPPVQEVSETARREREELDAAAAVMLTERGASLAVCVAATDVHEYGKMMVERTLMDFGVKLVDAGVHAEPAVLARLAREGKVDAIAISTFNGVALDYLESVVAALEAEGMDTPVFIGGRLNQIPKSSNTSLPVDVRHELEARGAIPCSNITGMLERLAAILKDRPDGSGEDRSAEAAE